MTLRAAALALALVPTPNAAFATVEGWPALFDVVGVETGDVLNIRNAPSVSGEIVGEIEPAARGVEVIDASDDGGWGRVNAGEVSGWASLDFLKRQPGQWTGQAPETAQCYGTEPFWSLALNETGATFETPEALPLAFERRTLLRSRNRIDRHAGVYENDLGGLVATLSNTTCSDGMSDRAFGWGVEVLLVVAGDGNAQLFSGCCLIASD